MDHEGLLKRINEATDTPPSLMEDFGDPGRAWKDEDKRRGHWRCEFTVAVPKLISHVKNLFGNRREKS